MKNGLILEGENLVYYKDDQPYHAGAIQVDGAIYYINSQGYAVKGPHIVHREKCNDILKRGTYVFGDDYKLIEGSYVAPKKKKRKRSKRFAIHIRRKTLRTVFIAFALFVTLGIVSWAIWAPDAHAPADTENNTVHPDGVVLPQFNQDVLLCSPSAKQEFDREISLQTAIQTGKPYRPFLFQYKLINTSGTLFISESQDMTNPREIVLPEDQSGVSIDNLKTDTMYYYKVVVGDQTYTGSFRTAPSTRFLTIPGLANVRDIGGYTTTSGRQVKQGLLIRGPEIDGLVNPDFYVTAEDLTAVQKVFGFAYDLDLRASSVHSGIFTPRLGIPHKFYDAPMYGAIFNTAYLDSLRQIFSDLANPQNYPVYMHCTWGIDRTGTIVFLLQGILGLSDEDMLREYQLTGYVKPEILDSQNMNVVISGLEPYEGDTLSQKVVTYLTTVVGVTEEEIQSIRNIFLTE